MKKQHEPPWQHPAPAHTGAHPLSAAEKRSARASARAAGRPYPNLVDNLRVIKRRGAKKTSRHDG